jgi:hypothetical protein
MIGYRHARFRWRTIDGLSPTSFLTSGSRGVSPELPKLLLLHQTLSGDVFRRTETATRVNFMTSRARPRAM